MINLAPIIGQEKICGSYKMQVTYCIDADDKLDRHLLKQYANIERYRTLIMDIYERDWPRDVRCQLTAILDNNGMNIHDIFDD